MVGGLVSRADDAIVFLTPFFGRYSSSARTSVGQQRCSCGPSGSRGPRCGGRVAVRGRIQLSWDERCFVRGQTTTVGHLSRTRFTQHSHRTAHAASHRCVAECREAFGSLCCLLPLVSTTCTITLALPLSLLRH